MVRENKTHRYKRANFHEMRDRKTQTKNITDNNSNFQNKDNNNKTTSGVSRG